MIIISVADIQVLIKKVGLKAFYARLIKNLKEDFSRWENFQKSPRHALHYPFGVIELMPVSDHQYYAFKYVNGHPRNASHNKPTVMATGQLSHVLTGEPLLFSEMTITTAFRTAAVSALAAEYMLKKNAKTMTVIGTGAQSEFQVLAFYYHTGISVIRFYDKDPAAMEKFALNLSKYPLKLIQCNNIDEAVEGTDCITLLTASKSRANIVHQSQVKGGVFINAVGGDCPGKTELDENIMHNSRVVVEYIPQSLIEGEIQNIGADIVYAELWELTTGKKQGRLNEEEVTVFDSVGFAIEDYSTLRLIYQLAKEYNVGQTLPMIPNTTNPKNLFEALTL